MRDEPGNRAAPSAAACLLAVGLGVVCYLNALGNPFVYDDRVTIVENPSIVDVADWRQLLGFSVFRPVVNVSYALDRAVWGLRPFGFHLTGLLLHALNVALVYLLAGRAAADLAARGAPAPAPRRAAFWTASLFAVHPMLVEAVQYVSARPELLGATFSLASLLALRRAATTPRASWVVAGTAAMVPGLASNEAAAAVPVLAVLYDRIVLPGTPADRRRRLLRVHLAPLLVAGAAGAARLAVWARVEADAAPRTFLLNAMLQCEAAWHYAGLMLVPARQSIAHEFRAAPWWNAAGLAAAAALVMLVAAAWRARHRAPLTTLGVGWFLVALVPSGLLPLAEVMAEHRVYLASAGLLLALVDAGSRLADILERRLLAGPAKAAGVLALAGLAAATMARNRVWSDPLTLWQDAAAKAPGVYGPHYEVGNELRLRNRCKDALAEYRIAVEKGPDRASAWVNLGICAAETGAMDEAEGAFRQVTVLEPGNPQGWHNLGRLVQLRGDSKAARHYYSEALRVAPGHELARRALDALPQEP